MIEYTICIESNCKFQVTPKQKEQPNPGHSTYSIISLTLRLIMKADNKIFYLFYYLLTNHYWLIVAFKASIEVATPASTVMVRSSISRDTSPL